MRQRLKTYMLLNKATVAAVEFALEDMTRSDATFGSRKVVMLHFQTTASLPLYIGTELPCETVLGYISHAQLENQRDNLVLSTHGRQSENFPLHSRSSRLSGKSSPNVRLGEHSPGCVIETRERLRVTLAARRSQNIVEVGLSM